MKSMKIAAVAACLIASPALAQTIPSGTGPGGVVNSENPEGFSNMGQCRAALAHATNSQRQNPDTRTASRLDESTSEFQQAMLDRFYCDYDTSLDAYVVYTDE
jgi:hypothetical protein